MGVCCCFDLASVNFFCGNFMNLRKSIRFNQNFFKDAGLVAAIVRQADFNPQDIVYEIGSGQGIITRELAKKVKKVVAVEIDKELFIRLKQKLAIYPNVQLINDDFLKYKIPDLIYKVFANIPFNITADVLRKLLTVISPPISAYLVVQKEAGQKFAGTPKETQFSILAKPWFELEIVRSFRKTDFEPMPSVETVLLKITKRSEALVAKSAKDDYFWFVQYGFNRWRANLGKNFKEVFTYKQWHRLAHDLKFQLKAQPTDLTFNQWLGIFNFYLKTVLK